MDWTSFWTWVQARWCCLPISRGQECPSFEQLGTLPGHGDILDRAAFVLVRQHGGQDRPVRVARVVQSPVGYVKELYRSMRAEGALRIAQREGAHLAGKPKPLQKPGHFKWFRNLGFALRHRKAKTFGFLRDRRATLALQPPLLSSCGFCLLDLRGRSRSVRPKSEVGASRDLAGIGRTGLRIGENQFPDKIVWAGRDVQKRPRCALRRVEGRWCRFAGTAPTEALVYVFGETLCER